MENPVRASDLQTNGDDYSESVDSSWPELPAIDQLQPDPPLPATDQLQLDPPLPATDQLQLDPPLPGSMMEMPFTLADWLLALSFVITGFFFFLFSVFNSARAGLGISLFFLLPLTSTLAYLLYRKIRLNLAAWALFALAVVGAIPFVAFGGTAIHLLAFIFECSLCLLWLVYSCRTLIARPLSWLLAFDVVNQYFIVPFINLGMVFRRIYSRRQKHQAWISALVVVAALLVSLPLLSVVLILLSSSDARFEVLLTQISNMIDMDTLVNWCINLVLGLPLAIYLFSATIGNATRRYTDLLPKDTLLRGFSWIHAIPRFAVFLPLFLFILIYVAYFAVMSAYLFAGLGGELPAGFTYAEYARRGFFELFIVASINAMIIGVIWSLAKRQAGNHPKLMRALTAVLCLLTELLLVTAASKMYLYVRVYGFTLLRFYTSWFMIALAVAFLLVLVWCLKPYNAARPIIALFIGAFLALTLVFPAARIANFNTQRYLSQVSTLMDVSELESYGTASLPALQKLKDQAPDPIVRSEAQSAINKILYGPQAERQRQFGWYGWNFYASYVGMYD
ncbi:MAG: DUF4173 domain-containing protein [Coriobacteriales bacterium]|jgi:hypothetical protein|nr:DUF4173 domain-containing protein [Coriobacteriales bacterium]